MARKKKAKAAVVEPTIACAVCHANVIAAEYPTHIQQFHAPTQPVRAQIPAYTPPAGAPEYQQPPQAGSQQQMRPLTGPIDASKLVGGNYLKGTDVPDGQTEVRIRITGFVLDPRGRSKLVAAIEPPEFAPQKTVWGLNTTNIRALSALGFADLQQACGRSVVCMVGLAPNPQQNGAMTRSLFVQRVEWL